MPFWIKPLQMDMGYSLVWVAQVILGQTNTNGHGLLMPFWVKPLQMDLGCSLVWVAHVIWVYISSNESGLLFCVGCLCQFGSNHNKWAWVAL